jgi:hypothetical protein
MISHHAGECGFVLSVRCNPEPLRFRFGQLESAEQVFRTTFGNPSQIVLNAFGITDSALFPFSFPLESSALAIILGIDDHLHHNRSPSPIQCSDRNHQVGSHQKAKFNECMSRGDISPITHGAIIASDSGFYMKVLYPWRVCCSSEIVTPAL